MSSGDRRERVSSQVEGSVVPDQAPRPAPQETPQAGGHEAANPGSGRPTPELISLVASAAIVLGLLAAITLLYLAGSSSGAAIEVTPEFSQVSQRSGNYYLPLTITNRGGATAEDVIVEVSLDPPIGQPETSDVTIDFLAGNATEDAVVVFSEDPEAGELSIDVVSYLDP